MATKKTVPRKTRAKKIQPDEALAEKPITGITGISDMKLPDATPAFDPLKLTREHVERMVKSTQYMAVGGSTTTVCALVLHNGQVVIGESHVLNPADYRWDLGCTCAREEALRKAFEFAAYERRNLARFQNLVGTTKTQEKTV